MVNFMQPFVPHLSHHTTPLHAMLQKNATFNWTPSANMAFQKLRSLLVSATETSLKYFNRNLPITVQVDASSEGLGAALLQQGQAMAFASKRLHDREKHYTNIDIELLVLIFTFIAESDHKPLEMITLKNLVAAPPRLQRMLLCLQQYDVTVQYCPGKEMLLIDALSHLNSPSSTITLKLDVRIDQHGFITHRLQQLRMKQPRTLYFQLPIDIHWMVGQRQEDMYLILPEHIGIKERDSVQTKVFW